MFIHETVFFKFQVFRQQIRQARNITYKTNVFTYKESSNVIISSTIFLCWFYPRYDKRTACYIIKIVFRILKHFQSQYQVPFGKQFGFCCINRSTFDGYFEVFELLNCIDWFEKYFSYLQIYLSYLFYVSISKKYYMVFWDCGVCFYLLSFHFNCHKLTKYLLGIFIGRNPKIFSIPWELLQKIQLMLLKKL